MEGLTRQEVEYRKNNGLSNDEKVKYTRTTKEIVLSNTITLFNILNIALMVLTLTTGSIQNATFIGTAVFNTIIAIYQELKRDKSSVKISIFCSGPVNTNFNNVANVKFNISSLTSEFASRYAIDNMFKNKIRYN